MKRWLASLVLVLLVALDQITKFWAKAYLEGKDALVIIKNILEFRYLEGGNTGAAFGILQGNTFFLGMVSLIVFLVLLVLLYKMAANPRHKFLCWCLVFMAAGAVGNCIDRLVNGYVVDFIYFKAIDFPIFNVADIYVTLSALVLLLLVAFSKEENEEKQEVQENE